jgi:LPS-assembly protein
VQDPDWKISFTEGKLNRESSFLHLYNSLFYIRNVPVFYLPYFGFSTDRSRRSGLLIPFISVASDEGLIYEQPIYIASQDHWDVELRPQIRTDRGRGLYADVRFLDSPNSGGTVSMGYFKEQDSYAKEENLKNSEHYGIEVEYQRHQLLSHLFEKETQDGLWIDAIYLNDIDYFNLNTSNEEGATHSLATSKLNYYLSQEENYVGVYGKYYIDTKKVDNGTTLQELPTLQYHRALNHLFIPNLLYSADTQFRNYVREEGVSARQYEMSLPLTFHAPLFGDFLNVSVSENFYATHVQYENRLQESTETLYRNFHRFSLYSDLAKPYASFYHTLNLRLDYTVPSFEHGEITEEFIATDTDPENVAAKLVQYFYDEAGSKRVRHAISQPFYLDEAWYEYGPLENSIAIYLPSGWNVQNEFRYSHEFEKMTKIQSSISWSNAPHRFTLSHTLLDDPSETKKNYVQASFDTKLGKYYNAFGSIKYDVVTEDMSAWQVGIKFFRKCWDYTLVYKESISPKLTSAGSDSVNKRGIFIMFNLYPIGAVQYEHTMEDSGRDVEE